MGEGAYTQFDFAAWSARAELVDNVASALASSMPTAYSGFDLDLPGYVFRDGRDNKPQSFIIAAEGSRWWSILWSGERVEADNLLDVAIDVWQSRLQVFCE